ncbi:MAG: alkaline phosphatase family protein, partial [Planctomycetota bacterium]
VDLWNDLAPLLDPEQTLDALHREFPRARTVDAEAEPEQYGLNDRLVRDLGWTWSGDAGFALGAEYCLDNDPAPLVMVYQSLPDVAGHRFWRYHRPADFDYAASIPQRALEDFAEHVELSYKHSDLALGRLLERIDEDWNVIVCSDHGMHADQTMLDDPWAITSGHHRDAPDGLLVVSGPAFEHGAPRLAAGDEPLAELRELAPLVLRLLDLDVPDHWRFADELSPVFGLLDSAWSAEHPLRTARFDDAAWRRRNPRGAPEDPGSGSSAEFLERFKALGYIDADAAVDGE